MVDKENEKTMYHLMVSEKLLYVQEPFLTCTYSQHKPALAVSRFCLVPMRLPLSCSQQPSTEKNLGMIFSSLILTLPEGSLELCKLCWVLSPLE